MSMEYKFLRSCTQGRPTLGDSAESKQVVLKTQKGLCPCQAAAGPMGTHDGDYAHTN